MTIDKDRLKALAEAATQGDWERDGNQVCPVADQNSALGAFHNVRDAAYISALQPSVVLAMLAESERLRKALISVMREVDENIRETVRDCVNGLPDVQDIYGYCDRIETIIGDAL